MHIRAVCFKKIENMHLRENKRSTVLELLHMHSWGVSDVEISDLDLFRCGGLCWLKVSIGDVWIWFGLCFWKVSMRRSVRLEVFDVEIRDLDMFRCGGLSFWMSLIGDVWFWLD